MRLKNIVISSVCIILAAGFLIMAGLRLDYINSERYQMKLIINEPLENAPPSLAFATVAMGAFRGLLVDILWIRADRLKEQGQFFDAKQLAEWITILQPRFPSVWEFHAWNMAYNISVAIPATAPEERWQWVKNGYELLRDKGIVLNPKSILLYKKLAWIFQHKIGGVSDDVHKYYKLQLALAMEPLVGPADNAYFAALSESVVEFEQIIQDANVAQLVFELRKTDEAFEDDEEFVQNYLSLRRNPGRFNPDAFKVIDDYRGKAALEKFDIFAKADQLRRVWKLDPVIMHRLNQTYGPINWGDPNTHLPLDWRHPDSHAIYWAAKGLQAAGKKDYSVGEINTDRIVFHSLQSLFRGGSIYIYDASLPEAGEQRIKTIFLHPNLMMFEICDRAWLDAIAKYEELDGNVVALQNGHRNFLKNAVLSFYQAGHKGQGRKIFNELRKLYPRKEFDVPLVVFARNRLMEELQSIGINDAREIIITLLWESYSRYAIRDDDEAAGREKMAQEVYQNYVKEFHGEETLRLDLPEFGTLRYLALNSFLNDPRYPVGLRQALMGRIKIEKPEIFEQLQKQHEKLLRRQGDGQ